MDKPVITGNTMIIPSDQEYLADIDAFLEATLRGYNVEESVVADIAISVSELVINAILHGNKSSAEKSVTIKIKKVNDAIRITVSDQGGGFDPEDIDDPLAEENLLKEVGRGIFVVRSLMDSVDIEPSPGGTTVTISKAI